MYIIIIISKRKREKQNKTKKQLKPKQTKTKHLREKNGTRKWAKMQTSTVQQSNLCPSLVSVDVKHHIYLRTAKQTKSLTNNHYQLAISFREKPSNSLCQSKIRPDVHVEPLSPLWTRGRSRGLSRDRWRDLTRDGGRHGQRGDGESRAESRRRWSGTRRRYW